MTQKPSYTIRAMTIPEMLRGHELMKLACGGYDRSVSHDELEALREAVELLLDIPPCPVPDGEYDRKYVSFKNKWGLE